MSEQPHSSIETVASAALVITRIFAPITADPGTPRALIVTCITPASNTPLSLPCRGELIERLKRWQPMPTKYEAPAFFMAAKPRARLMGRRGARSFGHVVLSASRDHAGSWPAVR